MSATPTTDRLTALREIVGIALQGAEVNQRPDLARRLQEASSMLRPACVATADLGEAGVIALDALRSLEIDLRARRAVLRDPVRAGRLAAEQRYAENRARAFQLQAGEWQPLLLDGIGAAVADVEFGLRTRLRRLVDEAGAAIERREARPQVEQRLAESLELEARTAYEQLREALERLAAGISGTLGTPAPARLGELPTQSPAELVAQARAAASTASTAAAPPRSSWVLGVVMPTYGGTAMTLMLPKFLGVALPGWLSATLMVGGALLMGGSALAAERERRRSRGSAEALAAVRAMVETFQVALSKQVRDAVRPVQQGLRRELTVAVEERARRLAAETAAAREAAEEAQRAAEVITDVDDDLRMLGELSARLRTLLRPTAA